MDGRARRQLLDLDRPVIDPEDTRGPLQRKPQAGHALRGELNGIRSLRVGTSRIVYQLAEDDQIVGVVAIRHLPLLLALSGNSPFWRGRDSGFASIRTVLFQAFPRTGIPRRYGSYSDWVQTVDLQLRAGAIPEPTLLWWDVRPQPRLGTVEVRVMDAQSRIHETASLVALTRSIARLELEEGYASDAIIFSEEVLAENHFLAARDGVDARLIDPITESRRPLREQLIELLEALHPTGEAGLAGLVAMLAGVFAE